MYMDGCSEITGAGKLAIVTHCLMLHMVGFGNMDLATETDLLLGMAHLVNVKEFTLTCSEISDDVLEQIAEHMHMLEGLNIGEGEDHVYTVVVVQCEKLRSLDFNEPHEEVTEAIVAQWYAMRPGLKIDGHYVSNLNLPSV